MRQRNNLGRGGRPSGEHQERYILTVDWGPCLFSRAICVALPVSIRNSYLKGAPGTLDTHNPVSSAPGRGFRRLELAGQMFGSKYGMCGEFRESSTQFGQCERRVQGCDTSAGRHNCEEPYHKFGAIVRYERDRGTAVQSKPG